MNATRDRLSERDEERCRNEKGLHVNGLWGGDTYIANSSSLRYHRASGQVCIRKEESTNRLLILSLAVPSN